MMWPKGASASRKGILVVKPKAIALLSGGLDSQLAIKLMQEQGIEVLAMHYESPLCGTEEQDCAAPGRRAAVRLGVPLVVKNTWDQILEAVKHPRYGHGKGVNPCIDCRIIHFNLARRLMEEEGADFIVTGEVLGQRPMSQHRQALATIEREARVQGKVLRPLSAHNLEPTQAEREGLVDRSRLLGLTGRNRKPQMALAEELGLEEYPMPAGGCLLTEPGFGRRFRRLQQYLEQRGQEIDVERALLISAARHFISSDGEWISIARNDEENDRLLRKAELFSALGWGTDATGPVCAVLTEGPPSDRTLGEAADLIARYGQGRGRESVTVIFGPDSDRAAAEAWQREFQGSPQRGRRLAEKLERA